MNMHSIFSLPRKVIRHYKHVAKKAGSKMLPQRQELLFVYGGRTQHWEGMGAELYAREPVFRSSINESEEIIRQLGADSILPNFTKPVKVHLFDNEASVIFVITALQMALTDLWLSMDIFPNAIMGVSIGEVAAVYAAGGLTKKDALKITASNAHISSLEKNEFIVLHLSRGFSETNALSKKCAEMMPVIYEIAEENVLVFCNKKNKDRVTQFLEKEGVAWQMPHEDRSFPYHTQLILKHRETLLSFTREIVPKPLRCDYFSSNGQQHIPRGGLIDSSFWYELKYKPVMLHSTLQLVKKAGLRLLLHIGPHPFLNGQVFRSVGGAGGKVLLLDSMRRGENEMQVLEEARKIIKRTRLNYSAMRNGEDSFEVFRQGFHLAASHILPDPYPYLSMLRKKGSVHFLPAHQAYIVLDYNDIDHVLKTPEVFSSSIHQAFDESLLGADPPSHSFMRSLLQPLFSKRILTLLETHTRELARSILKELKEKKEFNFVDEFSIPLSQAVAARFLGLSIPEEKLLKSCMNGHVYGLAYFDALQEYFTNYLEQYKQGSADSAGGLLLSLVKEGKLSFTAAVRIMRMLWIAGMTTTSMLISSMIHFLAKDQEIFKRLSANEELVPKFIEECLRLEAPESETRRITTREVELGGSLLPPGAIVMLSLRAANRDPSYFDQPDAICFDRPAKRHLSFGGGYHHCLGMAIARTEAREVIRAVLEQTATIKLADEDAVAYFPSPHFRGLSRLMVSIK